MEWWYQLIYKKNSDKYSFSFAAHISPVENMYKMIHYMIPGEVFTPYYTGQVIQAIAIDRNQKQFIVAIMYMTFLSVARWEK